MAKTHQELAAAQQNKALRAFREDVACRAKVGVAMPEIEFRAKLLDALCGPDTSRQEQEQLQRDAAAKNAGHDNDDDGN